MRLCMHLCVGVFVSLFAAFVLALLGRPPPSDPVEAEATKPYHEDNEYGRRDPFVPPPGFSLKNKVVLITGGSAGIGKEVAATLSRLGATVVITGRTEAKTQQTAESIMKDGGGSVHGMALELSSLANVRRFAAEFLQEYSRLDYVFLNAGMSGATVNGTVVGDLSKLVTEDGFEVIYASNYVGHFLLLNLLLPMLKATDGDVRVAVCSSVCHWEHSLPLETVLPTSRESRTSLFESGASVYGNSKLAQILMSFELQRRLQEEGAQITVTPVDPGFVDTAINDDRNYFMHLTMLTPAEGAYTALYALLAPQMRGATGFLLQPTWTPKCHQVPWFGVKWGQMAFEVFGAKFPGNLGVWLWPPHPNAHNREFGKRLWEESLQAVGLQA